MKFIRQEKKKETPNVDCFAFLMREAMAIYLPLGKRCVTAR